MKFSKSIIEIIQSRSSWRTYVPQSLEDELKKRIHQTFQIKKNNPFGGPVRFELIEMPELDPNERNQLGTYGFIKGAQYFIVAAMQQSKYDLENLGYRLEEIILRATDLGLGTCWLGGTFKRSAFGAKINVTADEIVPAATPIGHTTLDRSLREKIIRWAVKARHRLPWHSLFFEDDFNQPLSKDKAGKYAIPLEMVRLSPSASNKQPWRVLKEVESHNYHFFILRKGRNVISRYDFPRIDLGIAICHFNLTVQELSLTGKWNFTPLDTSFPDLEYLISWSSES
ncbi:MAG: nitroreductase family protein [Candidatus Hodarchaeota archaeon]